MDAWFDDLIVGAERRREGGSAVAGMPYHLEKGPIFSTIEAFYNDRDRLPGFLQKLWGGQDPLGTLGVLTSPSADDPNPGSANGTGPKRKSSMVEQWFGEVGGVQPPWGTVHPDP